MWRIYIAISQWRVISLSTGSAFLRIRSRIFADYALARSGNRVFIRANLRSNPNGGDSRQVWADSESQGCDGHPHHPRKSASYCDGRPRLPKLLFLPLVDGATRRGGAQGDFRAFALYNSRSARLKNSPTLLSSCFHSAIP